MTGFVYSAIVVQTDANVLLVHGAWCVVRGAWCMVHGAWCMVRGAWCVVHGVINRTEWSSISRCEDFKLEISFDWASHGSTLRTKTQTLALLNSMDVVCSSISFTKQ